MTLAYFFARFQRQRLRRRSALLPSFTSNSWLKFRLENSRAGGQLHPAGVAVGADGFEGRITNVFSAVVISSTSIGCVIPLQILFPEIEGSDLNHEVFPLIMWWNSLDHHEDFFVMMLMRIIYVSHLSRTIFQEVNWLWSHPLQLWPVQLGLKMGIQAARLVCRMSAASTSQPGAVDPSGPCRTKRSIYLGLNLLQGVVTEGFTSANGIWNLIDIEILNGFNELSETVTITRTRAFFNYAT